MALGAIVRLRAAPHCVVERAKLVLTHLEGVSLRKTAATHRSSVSTVRRWVGWWKENPNLNALRDQQRTGRRPTFGLRETAKVLSMVSQSPAAYDRVVVTWTQGLVVEVLAAEGVFMSRSTV